MKIEIENTVIVAINRKETKKKYHRNKSSVAGDNCRYARFL